MIYAVLSNFDFVAKFTVKNLNKDFIKAVRGEITVLWKYFIKFRYFWNDGFPKCTKCDCIPPLFHLHWLQIQLLCLFVPPLSEKVAAKCSGMHSVIVPSHPPETSSQALRMCYFPVLLSFSHNCSTSLSVNSWRANAADLTHRPLIFWLYISLWQHWIIWSVSMFAPLRLSRRKTTFNRSWFKSIFLIACECRCFDIPDLYFPVLVLFSHNWSTSLSDNLLRENAADLTHRPLILWCIFYYITELYQVSSCLHLVSECVCPQDSPILATFLSKALFKAYLSIAATSCTMACWRVLKSADQCDVQTAGVFEPDQLQLR